MSYIDLTAENIEDEHICCGFSDKKCSDSYQAKKEWLCREFEKGYRFYRLNERAKVFIEYGPSEAAWLPIEADNFFNINCFWVSGRYKKQGYAKKLLARAESEALSEGRSGLVTVTGKKKFHFMSDGKWFLKNGFEIVDETETGFILLAKLFESGIKHPHFNEAARNGNCPHDEGFVAYYSNRCPFAEYHVRANLTAAVKAVNIPLKIIKLETISDAKASPTPATVFSLFKDGKFITTDLSICMENRFQKVFKGDLI